MSGTRDLPLFAWGETVRAVRRRRSGLIRRLLLGALGCGGLVATVAAPPRLRLVWNASASAPIGLYWIAPASTIGRGDMVIARMPTSVRKMAAARHYIPATVPLVKRVAAVSGDRVCAVGDAILINGRIAALRRARDSRGRALPRWRGCTTLFDGAVLLLMNDVPDSFDGRYFGPVAADDVIGKASALWVR